MNLVQPESPRDLAAVPLLSSASSDSADDSAKVFPHTSGSGELIDDYIAFGQLNYRNVIPILREDLALRQEHLRLEMLETIDYVWTTYVRPRLNVVSSWVYPISCWAAGIPVGIPWLRREWESGQALHLTTCYDLNTPYFSNGYPCLKFGTNPSNTASNFGRVVLVTCVGGMIGFVLWNIGSGITYGAIRSWYGLKQRSEAEKTESVVRDLEIFGRAPVNLSTLTAMVFRLGLSEEARQRILRHATATELLQIRQVLGEENFTAFTADALTENQGDFLLFLSKLDTLSIDDSDDIEGLGTYLESFQEAIDEDLSLWEEIVIALNPELFKNASICETLVWLGRNTAFIENTTQPKDLPGIVKVLREDFQIEIVNNEGNVIEEIEISGRTLLLNDFLKRLFSWHADEDTLGVQSFAIEIEDESEVRPLLALFTFMETGELLLDDDLALSLMPVANLYHVKECFQECYNHLMKNKDNFELFSLLESVLRVCGFEDPQREGYELLKARFDGSFESLDYQMMDQCLQFERELDLGQDLEQKIRNWMQSNIKESPEDITWLDVCSETKILYPLVEEEYKNYIIKNNFKQIWEYADRNERTLLKEECFSIFKDLQNPQAFLRLWGPGEAPQELLDLLKTME